MGHAQSHPSTLKEKLWYRSVQPAAGFLDFEPAESYMVSYGIDLQTHTKFSHRTLSSMTVNDAREATKAMTDAGVVPPDNTRVYAARQQPETCEFAGMRRTFQECAQKVGPNGLFIFHFSGHGIQVGNNDEWGLVPVDFDKTRATYITANVLNSWLHEAGWKGKHILLTLDCCYAGGIAEELVSVKCNPISGLYAMCACTACETSLALGPLGLSIFVFSLISAVKMFLSPEMTGHFPVQQIFNECHTCSVALSSFIVHYDPAYGLKWGAMEPELKSCNLKSVTKQSTGEGLEQTDRTQQVAMPDVAIRPYCDNGKPIIPFLDNKWLDCLKFLDLSSAVVLELRDGGTTCEEAGAPVVDHNKAANNKESAASECPETPPLAQMQPFSSHAVERQKSSGETSTQAGRFRFATQLFDLSRPVPSLSETSTEWLEALMGPLIELERRNLLQGRVVKAVLCAMLYSVASIEMACNRENITDPNLFVTAFIHVVATIDLSHRDAYFNEDQFLIGWGFYHNVLEMNKIDDGELKELYDKAVARMNHRAWDDNGGSAVASDQIEPSLR